MSATHYLPRRVRDNALVDGQKCIVSFWVVNLESTRGSLDPQSDRLGITRDNNRQMSKFLLIINYEKRLQT